jgi:hypothetical protein
VLVEAGKAEETPVPRVESTGRGDVPVVPVCMVEFDAGNGALVNGAALSLPVGRRDGVDLDAEKGAVPLEVEVGAVPVGPTAELEFVTG